MKKNNLYCRPYIDIVLDEYFPKKEYPKETRDKAYKMAIEFSRHTSKQRDFDRELNYRILIGK